MRRALLILNLFLLSAVLIAWPVSHYRAPAILIRGRGGALEHGTFYFASSPTDQTLARWISPGDYREEQLMELRVRRWIPVRHLVDRWEGDSLWSVEAWFVTLVLAVPATMLSRRRRRDAARGFEVRTAEGGEA